MWQNSSSLLLEALSQQPHGIQVPALLPLCFQCCFCPFICLGSAERLCQGRTNSSWAPWKGPAGQGCLCLHLALPPFYSGSREAAGPCSEREADGAQIQCACAAHLFGTKMTDTHRGEHPAAFTIINFPVTVSFSPHSVMNLQQCGGLELSA